MDAEKLDALAEKLGNALAAEKDSVVRLRWDMMKNKNPGECKDWLLGIANSIINDAKSIVAELEKEG